MTMKDPLDRIPNNRHRSNRNFRNLKLKTKKVKNPNFLLLDSRAQCLKITEKVSFIIASEASYVYILSGQKLIKNAKNGPFSASFLKT